MTIEMFEVIRTRAEVIRSWSRLNQRSLKFSAMSSKSSRISGSRRRKTLGIKIELEEAERKGREEKNQANCLKKELKESLE